MEKQTHRLENFPALWVELRRRLIEILRAAVFARTAATSWDLSSWNVNGNNSAKNECEIIIVTESYVGQPLVIIICRFSCVLAIHPNMQNATYFSIWDAKPLATMGVTQHTNTYSYIQQRNSRMNRRVCDRTSTHTLISLRPKFSETARAPRADRSSSSTTKAFELIENDLNLRWFCYDRHEFAVWPPPHVSTPQAITFVCS